MSRPELLSRKVPAAFVTIFCKYQQLSIRTRSCPGMQPLYLEVNAKAPSGKSTNHSETSPGLADIKEKEEHRFDLAGFHNHIPSAARHGRR